MLLENLNYVNFEDYQILKKNVEIGETGVDIDSKIEMKVNGKISIELSSSFKKILDLQLRFTGLEVA